MQPNINVYGNVADRQQQYFSQASDINSPPANRCPSFNNNNYSQLYYGLQNDRVQTDQPIDLSICYAALGTESDSSHCHSIVVENNELVLKSTDRDITNYFFWERTGTSYINVTNGAIALDSTYSWHGSIGDGNMNAQISPICDINVKNQVLCIRVRALNADKTTAIDVTLDEYLSQYVQYPNVFMVYAKSFNGWKIPRGSNLSHSSDSGNVEFGMGLLDPYCNYNGTPEIYCFAVEQHLNTSVYTPTQNMFVLSGSMQYNDTCRIANDNIPVLKAHDPENWIIEFANSNYVRVYKEITSSNIQEFFEECLKQCACFGLYFTPIENVAVSGTLTDNDMYIGVIDNGIGHGNYLKGNNTVLAPQNDYDSMSNIDYDPYNPHGYDNTNYTDGNIFKTIDLSLNATSKFYVLTDLQLPTLASKLYTIMADAPDNEPIEKYNTTVFLTRNPIDSILSIKRFPVSVPHFATTTPLKIGSKNTNITAYTLNRSCDVYYFDFKNSDGTGLYPTFGKSFLDYEPYTKININVPFCGTFDVPCNYFHNYGGVTVALIIDFITGAATALLLVKGDVVDSLTGSAAIDIPLTGLQSATIDSQIYNASLSKQKQDSNYALSMLGGAAAITLGVATGGTAAIIGGAAALASSAINKDINDKALNYELTHMQAPVKQVSSASSPIAQFCDTRCKMIISRPEYADNYNAEVYANTIGFACISNGKVSDYSGLTIGNIELDGVNCTAAEKDLIKTTFANGVYL